MHRHLRDDHFQCRPHPPFEEMTAMRGAVCFADDDVRMQPRLAVLWHNVPGEREYLDLFFNRNLSIALLLPVKEAECDFAEGTNGGQACI